MKQMFTLAVLALVMAGCNTRYEKTKSGENFTEKLLANKELGQLVDFAGIFVLEKRPGETLPEMKLWRITRQKTYGAT